MTDAGREYGTALFELAKEEGIDKEMLEILREVRGIFRAEPEYMELLSAPTISAEERVKAVDQAFRNEVPEILCSFLKLLTERGRIREYEKCVHQFELCYDDAYRHSFAKVYSAIPLTDDQKERLHAKLEQHCGHMVEMHYKIDPSLLGGLKVKMDGQMLDGSLRSRISSIKEVIEE